MLEYPQVALDFMNRDHADFVALRDRLLEMLSAKAPEAKVDTLLEELLAHTRHHFAEEERLMQETAFRPYPVHKGEHETVPADMATRIGRWKQGRDAVTLREWLDRDVGDWFFVTAGFIDMKKKAG